MYPEWLTTMFQSNPCSECRAGLTLSDIEAVGVRRPYPDGLQRPLAMVTCVCPHCGNRMSCTIDQPLEGVLAGVEALYLELADTAAPGNGMFQLPSVPAKKTGRARPSRRRNQPSAPPTEKEIRDFLARLKRMSFKTGSKDMGKLTGRKPRRPGPDDEGENRRIK